MHISHATLYVPELGIFFASKTSLRLDIWLGAANVLLQLEQVCGKLDVVLEVLLSIQAVLALVVLVLLNVQTDGGT